ncbi:hypothetical protein BLA29_015501 [Euroglyphus maynei]|uniref:Uncharacterized protein n=1 Tax=Euroglyphus maynei TaxID=6958 RepID=A0A1Y3AW48_EURMA|nr:hypothetical protein BLA29_015501 [Euroglyphus maynei]
MNQYSMVVNLLKKVWLKVLH